VPIFAKARQICPDGRQTPIRRRVGIGTCINSGAAADTEFLEPMPASERVPRDSLSNRLWGIDWSEHLPQALPGSVVVEASSFDRALPFIQAHYAEIFQERADGPFATRLSGRKERYYQIAGDFFEFVDGEKTVGLLLGTPVDWSTYYIRSAAVLPAYQGKKIIQRFFPAMFEVLRAAGVERVEADTSPSNMATLHLLTRLRFNPTGTVLSDRWGAMVHFTRFLDEESEGVFLRQFCAGVEYQQREKDSARETRKESR
jgi:GNAT superfamily N-acetyltransferase